MSWLQAENRLMWTPKNLRPKYDRRTDTKVKTRVIADAPVNFGAPKNGRMKWLISTEVTKPITGVRHDLQ